MAYVVARPGGRFELRESSSTSRGPRGRTLATFRELTDAVLDHADARATQPVDRAAARRSARRAGAPVAPSEEDARAGALLGTLALGGAPTPVRAHLVAHALAPDAVPEPEDHLRAAGDWAGADAVRRGESLVDLLGLVDAIPSEPRTGPLRFPRLSSSAP
jgi:hypothetical protein